MPVAAHLTSAHLRDDPRIFHKQCVALARNGWQTVLIVADGGGDAEVENVRIKDVGRRHGRFRRILETPWKVLHLALAVRADIYHLHDPELLPVGLFLRATGRRVIFDSHENYSLGLKSKVYLPVYFRSIAANLYTALERIVCGRFNALVGADPWIVKHLSSFHSRVVHVDNYPRLEEFASLKKVKQDTPEVCYVGALSEQRGLVEMVKAISLTSQETLLCLAGRFVNDGSERIVRALPGWSKVVEVGYVDRDGLRRCLGRAAIGLVTLRPEPNYLLSHPTKLFEYMAAGIPIIASDFPEWRRLIEGEQCGVCVNSSDPSAIAEAIDTLIQDPHRAEALGENGRRAIVERYNWSIEERKLLDLYAELIE